MKILPLFIVFFLFSKAWGSTKQCAPRDSIYKCDTVLSSQGNWVPFVLYGDETSWGTGVLYSYHFPSSSKIKVSNIQSSVTYTLKKQLVFAVISEYFTPNDKYKLSGELFVSRFPNIYYGIGKDVKDVDEEMYTPNIFKFSGIIQSYLGSLWSAGLSFSMQYEDVWKVEEGGKLDQRDITGSNPYWISGMGIVVGYDSRDNIFMSRDGGYVEMKVHVSHPWLGSDYGYRKMNFDFRRFFPLSGQRSLAFQIYMSKVWGETPFQELCQIGGPNILRGFLQGKYRDNFMGVVQSEYRYGIRNRWGGVVFLSVGNVAHSVVDFNTQGLKVAGGVGVRYQLNSNKTRIRFDYGVNNEGGTSMQFGILEAF